MPRRFSRPAASIVKSSGTNQSFKRGKRWSLTMVTINITATAAGNGLVALRDSATTPNRWLGGVTANVIGNTAHFDFPEGAKFEDGIFVSSTAGVDAYVSAVDISEGI